MTVRRGFLYVGVFLVAAGGVTLLTAAGVLDQAAVLDALRLWPLAVIAIGAGLVLRRTRAAIPGGLVAAVLPGLMFGAMFVAVPTLPTLPNGCVDLNASSNPVTTHEGSFGSTANVELSMSCGDLRVTTAPGTAWTFDAQGGSARTADVSATADSLLIRADNGSPSFGWNRGADDWHVTLPTDSTMDLNVEVNAGRGRLDLAGAKLDAVALDVNAGDAVLDLTGATLPRLTVDINAAAGSVHLPATGNLTGNLTVNAGSLDVCAPADLGLRVRGDATLGSITFNGLTRRGDAWESPGYATAPFHADLSVSASVGSVDINPQGGCK